MSLPVKGFGCRPLAAVRHAPAAGGRKPPREETAMGDPPKRGRSAGYSTEIADTICDRLINGESLRTICADPAMPARATVFRWLASNQEFRRSYARARECWEEDILDDILEIADDSS